MGRSYVFQFSLFYQSLDNAASRRLQQLAKELELTTGNECIGNKVLCQLGFNLFAAHRHGVVNRSFTIMRGKIMQGGIKNKIRNLILDTLLSDKKAFFTFFQKVAERLGRTKSYTYSELFGAWAQTISYRPTVFENYTEIEFEGRQYMIVRDYVEYLQVRYNRTDFREPKEKQVAPHIEFVDFSLPYKEYLRQKSGKGE